MTDQQINIAIAKAIGIKTQDKWGPLYKTNGGYVRTVPDFANDLNAMHEAEKMLTFDQQTDYLHYLALTITLRPPPNVFTLNETWNIAHATARQRAEALIKTINIELK